MADVGLSIKISADVLQATQAIGRVSDNLAELATEGEGNLTSITLAMQELKEAAAGATDPTQLGLFNRAIRDLGTEAKTLRSTGLAPLTSEVKTATLSAGQARVGFIDLFSVLQGGGLNARALAGNVALLGPIGLAAAVAIGAIGYALFEYVTRATAAEVATTELRKVMDESGASAQTEISKIDGLVSIIQDETSTRKERTGAFQELQSLYPQALKNIDLETSSSEQLSAAVDKLTSALFRQAQIKGLEDAIGDQYKKIAETLQQTGIQASTFGDKLLAVGQSFSGGIFNIGTLVSSLEGLGNQTQQEKVADYTKSIQFLSDQLKGLLKTSLDLGDKSLLGKNDPLTTELAALEQLKGELEALGKGQARPSVSISEELKSVDANILRDKIKEALQNGVKEGINPQIIDEQVAALQAELSKIGKVKPATIRFDLAPYDNAKEKTESAIEKAIAGKGIHLKVPADVELAIKENNNLSKEEKEILTKNLQEQVQNGLPIIRFTPNIQAALDKKTITDALTRDLNESIQKSVKGIETSGLSQIGKTIGDALGGQKNPLQNALKSFGDIIGDGLESIGKELISAGLIMQSVGTAIKSLFDNPLAAVAAGVAAVALGAFIKTELNNTGAHAFADGGIVTGPTYGLVGEAGPEAIFPLSKLNEFVKNVGGGGAGNVNVSGEFKIAGSDLRTVLSRANKNANMVGT